ncbi:hypothetical protein RJ035_007532 [Blastomyces gilchristii]
MRHARVAEHAAPDIGGIPWTWPVIRRSLDGMALPLIRALIAIDADAVWARAPFGSRIAAAVYGQDRRYEERGEG